MLWAGPAHGEGAPQPPRGGGGGGAGPVAPSSVPAGAMAWQSALEGCLLRGLLAGAMWTTERAARHAPRADPDAPQRGIGDAVALIVVWYSRGRRPEGADDDVASPIVLVRPSAMDPISPPPEAISGG